ncbi:DUF1479 domain-containing protein [Dongia deserti]|uniref:DUF1479 domain-containing protein n=1 Tax=Dongia deserti TaxID=2268030 RepID=UPI000E64E316|nr:DUF1479 domain-containing protein [Dongia deserti]
MSIDVSKLPELIRGKKAQIRRQIGDVEKVLAEIEADLHAEVDDIATRRAAGKPVIPEIDFAEVRAGKVSDATKAEIRRRGTAVIRNVFPRSQAEAWNDEIGEYLARNDYVTKAATRDAGDRYFTSLKSSRPQIFGIYWSKPQMEARQGVSMAEARAFLNRLWRFESDGKQHFDPDRECTYADRIRRREPGDVSLGLSPHMDAGSVERWLDPAYSQVYREVFAGNWRAYDPFDGTFRTETEEIPSPAVCSAFRTFQGWTALTRQGRGDGTLQLLPIARSIIYFLLRPMAKDVPEDDLCGAKPGRALSLVDQWHALLKPAITPIPLVEPGDTVWWHTDIIHAVEDRHTGKGYSNVIYIGAAPYCTKNAAYLQRQKLAFLSGESAPDFSAENFEVDFEGRAQADDLTALGKKQMGLAAW